MWGIANSNYAGNMGMALNPASMVASPYSWEFHLVSGDLFLENNYIYIRKKSSILAKSVNGEGVAPDRISDFYTKNNKNGFAQVNLKGPSFILNRGNFAVGLHTGFRMALSANRIPYHFAKFMYEGFDYEPQHGINYTSGPFSAVLLQWAEVGISLGGVLKEDGDNLFTGGFTLKYLAPMNAAFIRLNHIDYTVPNSLLLVVNNIDGSYGHTGFDADAGIGSQLFSKKGNGVAADLGVQYYHGRLERAYDCGKRSDDFKKYRYKIGFSAIDLGFVHMGKKARVFSFDDAFTAWPGIDTIKFENLADFDTSLSNQFTSNPFTSQTAEGFNIILPAAASLQFDYCLMPRWYVNASLIQRLPLGKNRILRPNQVSITPRYETRSFEVALPISSYEFTIPRVGLALRYKFLTLGTDKLGAFTGLWDIKGIDIYFGIKISTCGKSKKRVKGEDCFAY